VRGKPMVFLVGETVEHFDATQCGYDFGHRSRTWGSYAQLAVAGVK
jgi:hypothetical protein